MEEEREGEKLQCVRETTIASHTPTTAACALTGE